MTQTTISQARYLIIISSLSLISSSSSNWWHEHLKHVLCLNKSTCWARCKAVRPGHSARLKIRLTEAGTDLIIIFLWCSLSLKTVLTSRNIIVFKIKFPLPKNGHPSHARILLPRAISCPVVLSPQVIWILANIQYCVLDIQHSSLMPMWRVTYDIVCQGQYHTS